MRHAAGDVRAFDVDRAGRVVVAHSGPTAPVELYSFRGAEAGPGVLAGQVEDRFGVRLHRRTIERARVR